MDFELFNDCPGSSDMDMSMSDSGVAGLLFPSGSSPPDSMMLSLEEHTLSSFDDGKQIPLPSSSSNSSDCFYYIPDLNSAACSLVDAMKEDVIGASVDDKLFLKNEENGIWVLAEKNVRNDTTELATDLTTFKPSDNYPVNPAEPKFIAGHKKKPETTSESVITQTLKYNHNQPSPTPADSAGVATVLTGSKKRKSGITRNRSVGCDDSLREEIHLSKATPKSNEVKKGATKVANCKIKPVTEEFLKTLTDSVTQDVTNFVRQEVENAFNGLKTYLDEKLSQPVDKPLCRCHQKSQDDDFPDKSQNDNTKKSAEGGRNVNHRNLNTEAENRLPESKSDESNLNSSADQSDDHLDDNVATTKPVETKTNQSEDDRLESQSQPNDIQLSEPRASPNSERRRVATVKTLLKYVTLPSLVETLKKSIENSVNDDNNANQESESLNPVNVLNMSISSLEESEQTESNDTFSFTKYSLGIVKEEPFSGGEDESSSQAATNYLELFTQKNHFLDMDQSENQPETKEENETLNTPTASASESCTALVPYVPPSPMALTKNAAPKRRSKRERTFKPELSLRKYKKPLLCEICDRTFLNNSSLKQHMSFHRPQRPFQCDHEGCDKSYKTRSELNRHLIVHTGQKNYECRRCGKTFLRKQYLKTHLIRHNESLTWQCTLCAKIFVSEEDLNKHKVSYHRKNGKRSSFLMIEQEQPQKMAISFFDDSLEA